MKNYVAGVIAGVICSLIAIGALWQGLEEANGQATTTVQLPSATAFTVTNGATVAIAAANPGRRTFSICNGAAGSLVYVLPGTTLPTTTSGIPIASNSCLSPPNNALQSGTVLGGGNNWNAIASGANAVVAFIEW